MRNHAQTFQSATVRCARAAVLAGAAAVVLAGCSFEITSDEPSTPSTTQSSTGETQGQSPQPEGSGESTGDTQPSATGSDASGTSETTSSDTGQGGGGAGGSVPPPGTTVKVGDTITTHVQVLEPADQYYGRATMATTVTEAAPGDPQFWQQASNAEEFDGFVPWFVKVEYEWLTFEGEPNANMISPLTAYTAPGAEAIKVGNSDWTQGIPGCTVDIPDVKEVGAVATNCYLYAVPEGNSLYAVGWQGDEKIDGGGSLGDSPYWDNPVLWEVQ